MRYYFLLIFLLFAQLAKSSVTIQCENAEYKGMRLEFFMNTDPVTNEKVFSFALDFDENGKSSATFNAEIPTFTFCDFGIYRGMLLVEPNQFIQLNLPPLREKSFADKKNPYFVPVSFWFTTTNKKQVNNQISDFTTRLNHLTDKYFNQLYFRQSRQIYDSLLFFMDKDFGQIESESFRFHKKMKLKMVETEVFRIKPENYAEIFSGIKSAYWLFPSFTELFDKTFSAHLSFKAKSVKGDELRTAVNRSDYSFLLKHLKTNFNIEGEMADLVLLKMLYDAFFSADFQKDAVQKLVAFNRFTNSKNEIIKTTALNILEKFNHLQKGKEAPPVCLQSIDGQKICTNTNTQKFKYLVFADTEMIICREQLKQVSAIGKKFEKHLEIFVILRNTNRVEMKKFLSENKIGGIQLVDETNLFIREYNVKSFPQCFLLDENHKLELVTTPAPLDGFEQQFGSFLQRELFERQRNQSR